MSDREPPQSDRKPPRPAGRADSRQETSPRGAGSLIEELSKATLLAGLDRAALERLAAIARRFAMGTGETVFVQGDPARAFFLLIRGEVKIYKMTGDGRTATLRYVRPGDTFGPE